MPEAEKVVDISPEQNGAILKTIVKEGVGDGKPTKGSYVEVYIRDDTPSEIEKDGKVIKFNLGKGKIVKACEIAISTMRKGERAMIMCTPEYARLYPYASLYEFSIELIDWHDEDLSPKKNGGIQRTILIPGDGTETPNDGAEVKIHITGKLGDAVFDRRNDVSFCLGEGEDYDIVEGLEIALKKFKKGEMSQLMLKPSFAFGDQGSEKFEIPPNTQVEYVVTLESFTRTKDIWLMNEDEKVQEAIKLKEKGNSYFREGKFRIAIKMYQRVIETLKLFEDGRHIKADDPEVSSIFFSTHMNLCLCCLKTENYQEAKHSANIALRIHPDDEKANFRAGKVFYALGEYRTAIDLFQECLEINPNNKAALAEIKRCSKAIKDHIQEERKIYGQMFDRFAEVDSQRERSEMRMCNVMSSVGEWGAEDREREPSEFEKENPDILLLNKTGEFKDM